MAAITWTNPTLTSTYTNFVAELAAKDKALAQQFASDSGDTYTGLDTGTIRWNAATPRWEKWNGTAWAVLSTGYAITITGNAANVTGTVAIGNGGTGATTQQAAINALTGTQTAGRYLRSDGTNATLSTIQAADVPTLNQNTTGSAATLTTARTIALGTGVTGTATSFNGSANITIPVTSIDAAYILTGTLPAARISGSYDMADLGLGNGLVGTPALHFTGDPDTGLYWISANSLGITTGGILAATFDSSQNTNLVGVLGVKSAVPSSSVAINSSITFTDPNANRYGVQNFLYTGNSNGTTALTADRSSYGAYNLSESQVQNAAAFSHNVYGSYNSARTSTSAGNSVDAQGNLFGAYNYALHQTADATYTRMESAHGSYNYVAATGATSLIDNAYGVYSLVHPTVAGATITSGYLFYGTLSTVTGTFTNRWGVYIASAINNYFAGGIQIGGTATGSTSAAGLGVNTAPTGAGNINASGTVTAAAFSGPLTGNVTGTVTGDITGNAATVTNGVYLTSTQTLTNKTLTSPVITENVQVISTNTTAVRSRTYVLTASLTLTLPASPAAGDTVVVINRSATTTAVIARNAQNIMGLAEDMTLDGLHAGLTLTFTDATRGWVIR